MAITIVACSTGTATVTCGRASATISAAQREREDGDGTCRRQRGRRGATASISCGAANAALRRAPALGAHVQREQQRHEREAGEQDAGWRSSRGLRSSGPRAERDVERLRGAAAGHARPRCWSPGVCEAIASATSVGARDRLAVDLGDDVALRTPAFAAGPPAVTDADLRAAPSLAGRCVARPRYGALTDWPVSSCGTTLAHGVGRDREADADVPAAARRRSRSAS